MFFSKENKGPLKIKETKEKQIRHLHKLEAT